MRDNLEEKTIIILIFCRGWCVPIKKPYSGKNLSIQQIITNYRIYRARRIVENPVWIATWRAINASVQTATEVTKAVVVLHNFLMTGRIENRYCPIGYIDQEENGFVR